MKTWLPILAVGFALSLLANILFALNAYERTRVVSVPDGDSLDLADGRRIRLLGIDAPEKGRCMADQARGKLVSLAQGRHVRLRETVIDDYGRMLAIVIVDGSPLQQALVSEGLARNKSTASSDYNRVLKDAQEVAKSNKLGIWSDACRGETSGMGDCTIKGNVRQGKKQYYLPDCPYYPDVLVDTSFGDEWLCSEQEAKESGFDMALSCR